MDGWTYGTLLFSLSSLTSVASPTPSSSPHQFPEGTHCGLCSVGGRSTEATYPMRQLRRNCPRSPSTVTAANDNDNRPPLLMEVIQLWRLFCHAVNANGDISSSFLSLLLRRLFYLLGSSFFVRLTDRQTAFRCLPLDSSKPCKSARSLFMFCFEERADQRNELARSTLALARY